jgi:hypothetical protein
VKVGRALLAGFVGAVVAVLSFLVAHLVLGPAADPSSLLGSIVFPADPRAAWALGALLQLIGGSIAGIAYAIVFEFVFRHAGALVGVAAAIPHVTIAGIAVAWMHVGGTRNDPALAGAFLAFNGVLTAAWFVATHLVLGAVIGLCYGPTRHPASAAPVVWRELPQGSADVEAGV